MSYSGPVSEEATNSGRTYAFSAREGPYAPLDAPHYGGVLLAPPAVYRLCWCGSHTRDEPGLSTRSCADEAANFLATVGHMHVVQRFGCVVGMPCVLPVPRSLLVPVPDEPDLGAYVFDS